MAWALSHAVAKRRWKPEQHHLDRIAVLLSEEEEDTMAKRCLVDVFQKGELPEEQLGTLADAVIKLVRDHKETAAVRAFSVTVLGRIMKKYPELYVEVEDDVRQLARHEKPSMRIRAERVIKQMEKLHSSS